MAESVGTRTFFLIIIVITCFVIQMFISFVCIGTTHKTDKIVGTFSKLWVHNFVLSNFPRKKVFLPEIQN